MKLQVCLPHYIPWKLHRAYIAQFTTNIRVSKCMFMEYHEEFSCNGRHNDGISTTCYDLMDIYCIFSSGAVVFLFHCLHCEVVFFFTYFFCIRFLVQLHLIQPSAFIWTNSISSSHFCCCVNRCCSLCILNM